MSTVRQTTVLVVDDHALVAETVERALNAETDMTVVGRAPTVAAALLAARELRPDVVLMDFELPDGKGTDATVLIKEGLPNTEVVMVTGHADTAVLAAALESGCSGFVTKGGGYQELLAAIRAVVVGEVRFPQSMIGQLATYLRPRPAAVGSDLTKRELEVLCLLADGKSTAIMMNELYLSIHTVRNHVRSILMKLHAQSRLEAVAVAARLGLLGVNRDDQSLTTRA